LSLRPFLVVNPRSGNGATARHFDAILRAVRSAIGDAKHAFTERAMHAAELTRAALKAGYDLIVAVGGDGTMNEVVNGFFQPARPGEPPKPVRSGAALAMLPRGTGGDLRRTVGLDRNLDRCAARLSGESGAVDVGRVDYVADDGSLASRYFINVGEVGVGARVVEIANRSSKRLGGKVTFVLASLRALAGWHDQRVRASFDGGPAEDLSVTSLAIANGKYFGGGMMVAPEARLDDGQFHVTIWSGYGLSDFVFKSASMYDGSHVNLKGTRTRTARTVRVDPTGSEPVDIEVDGERVGRLPATFTILPGALQLVR
jgi:YegS/Rv2252/BmrU family lipid kinase